MASTLDTPCADSGRRTDGPDAGLRARPPRRQLHTGRTQPVDHTVPEDGTSPTAPAWNCLRRLGVDEQLRRSGRRPTVFLRRHLRARSQWPRDHRWRRPSVAEQRAWLNDNSEATTCPAMAAGVQALFETVMMERCTTTRMSMCARDGACTMRGH